jgi:hypothetical protein
MSVTTSEAIAAVRSRLGGGGFAFTLYYDGDTAPILPDTPATFGYVEFAGYGSALAAFGGGRGANVYRNSAMVNVWVFSPIGYGPEAATTHAEPVAARLRSYRDNIVSIYRADVVHVGQGSNLSVPGLVSEVSNYQCALVEAFLTFDLTG